jgi:hypothetical protein
MPIRQVVLAVVINLVVAGTLAALVRRGRARHCWSFLAYLCAYLGFETLVVLFQDTFYAQEFWMRKQAVYDILKMLVALEITWHVVRAFPGALRTARLLALTVLVGATVVLATGPHTAAYKVVFTWQPRVVACTAMAFTLSALLVAWYHLPMRAYHRAIMGGFAIYSAFFATLLRLIERWGWGRLSVLNTMHSLVFLGVALWWLRTAWPAEEEEMPVPPLVLEPTASSALSETAA